MQIHIEREQRVIRAGVEIRAPRLHLAAHGHNEAAAERALQSAVAAWCGGLESLGRLEQALDRLRIRWEDDGGPIRFVFEPLAT